MFAYLKGILAIKRNDTVVIDVNGVGYKLNIPYSTYQLLPEVGEEVKLNTLFDLGLLIIVVQRRLY